MPKPLSFFLADSIVTSCLVKMFTASRRQSEISRACMAAKTDALIFMGACTARDGDCG